jgi:hypothetical protein
MRSARLLFAFVLGVSASAFGQETVRTNIAHLRSLYDLETFAVADRETMFTVEGTVTTHVNLTDAPNFLFYIQDESAGIAVLWRNATFAPSAGDRVEVTARLDQFNGLTEFVPNNADETTSVTLIESNSPLPAAQTFQREWLSDLAKIEQLEGSQMVVSNVLLDASSPNFNRTGESVRFTEMASGIPGILRIDRRSPFAGQPKPTNLVTIYGAFGQFDSSVPYNSGYQITPTRLEDIVPAAHRPPVITFTNELTNLVRPGDKQTNNFAESVLLPGETLTLKVYASHPDSILFTLNAASELPAGARWNIPSESATEITAELTFTPSTNLSGNVVTISLDAATDHATNRATWHVYVPSVAEQGIVLTEFLANPPPASVAYPNPLNRSERPPATSHDEYIELVNFSDANINLAGWIIEDAVQIRHRFADGLSLLPQQAMVIYGGPLAGLEPALPAGVVAVPVSAGGEVGLGLNNTGGDTITIRNAAGNIVTRVVYSPLPSNASLTRSPDMTGAFVSHSKLPPLLFSPGLASDGQPWSVPAPTVGRISVQAAEGHIHIGWSAIPGRAYRVLGTSDLALPFTAIANDLLFSDASGAYSEPLSETAKYYRVELQSF